VIAGRQNFENAARDAVALLDRLIGIGVRSHRDRAHLIALARQLPFEERRRVGLREEAALEIESGREAHIGMRRPREAVDAAVLAAPIGIDRTIEADIGRIVPCDDGARIFVRHMRLKRRGRVERAPAVVEQDTVLAFEAAALVCKRAPAAAAVLGDPRGYEGDGVRQRGRPEFRGAKRGIGAGAKRAAGACYVATLCHASNLTKE
jgi:hypothetical protein